MFVHVVELHISLLLVRGVRENQLDNIASYCTFLLSTCFSNDGYYLKRFCYVKSVMFIRSLVKDVPVRI